VNGLLCTGRSPFECFAKSVDEIWDSEVPTAALVACSHEIETRNARLCAGSCNGSSSILHVAVPRGFAIVTRVWSKCIQRGHIYNHQTEDPLPSAEVDPPCLREALETAFGAWGPNQGNPHCLTLENSGETSDTDMARAMVSRGKMPDLRFLWEHRHRRGAGSRRHLTKHPLGGSGRAITVW
jgi:hypothetical protein